MTPLVFPASPAAAEVTDPVPITPEGIHATAADQATDSEGDTVYAFVADDAFNVRIMRGDGDLSPVVPLAPVDELWSYLEVAVDDDGDGIAIWDQRREDDAVAVVYARRFTRDGELGRLRQITPEEHWVADAEVAMRPRDGSAIITWNRITEFGYTPFVRTVSRRTTLGPVLKVGRGPHSEAPVIAIDRDGRATLLWTNVGLRARRMNVDGSLLRARMVRKDAFYEEGLTIWDLGIDRRGIITVACERDTRERTGTYPPVRYHDRACLVRISPRLRLLGGVRDISPLDHTIDAVQVGVAPNGVAVATWQINYIAGAEAVTVRRDGTLGESVKVSDGGIGDIVLLGDGDGVVASADRTNDGSVRIRATRIRNGKIGRTLIVGRANNSGNYLRAGLKPNGHFLVAWNDGLPPARTWVVTGR